MKKKFFLFLVLFWNILTQNIHSSEVDVYQKIDLFGEVLEKINKDLEIEEGH